ncbi:MAG: Hpt domain-containing protein, partial [bacterium]
MTAPNPVGFLDFFILEASDYVEQLDRLLDGGGASGPDADGLQRVARALRGSATMAKLLPFADVASGIERVGRALREGALRWDAGLNAVVVAAVDDCKLLLRSVRSWSEAEDARAHARVAELTQYAPLRSATPLVAPDTQGHDSYLATEASNIGAGLELLATRPGDRDAAINVLRRVRALRGIASVKDHPALADVLEAAEQAAHPLELGGPTLSAER